MEKILIIIPIIKRRTNIFVIFRMIPEFQDFHNLLSINNLILYSVFLGIHDILRSSKEKKASLL